MILVNNGIIGCIDFVVDCFGIVDLNNIGSIIFEGGCWLMCLGGFLLVYGKLFGMVGDLLFWIGVGLDVNVCSKVNGLLWFDNKGVGFFGGLFLVGIWCNVY